MRGHDGRRARVVERRKDERRPEIDRRAEVAGDGIERFGADGDVKCGLRGIAGDRQLGAVRARDPEHWAELERRAHWEGDALFMADVGADEDVWTKVQA